MNTKQKSKKWSKPLSVLLMLTLALSMLPAAAGAASEKRAAALDCTIFSNDVENYLATQGWSWNYASKTLTLNNVDIDTSDFSAVILPHGATVVLSGDNLIASTNEARYSNGIYCKGDATFKGDGSVTIKGVALGIICEANGNSGNIVVSKNARITVEDAKSAAISIPIGEGSFSRTLTIKDNARVNVNNAAGSAISVSDYVTIQDNAAVNVENAGKYGIVGGAIRIYGGAGNIRVGDGAASPLTAMSRAPRVEDIRITAGAWDKQNMAWISSTAEPLTSDMVAAIPDQPYTGSDIKPKPVVADGATILAEGVHYNLSYQKNKNIGTATVIVNSISNSGYIGQVLKQFTISPATALDADRYSLYIASNAVTDKYDSEGWKWDGQTLTLKADADGTSPALTFDSEVENATVKLESDITYNLPVNSDARSIWFKGGGTLTVETGGHTLTALYGPIWSDGGLRINDCNIITQEPIRASGDIEISGSTVDASYSYYNDDDDRISGKNITISAGSEVKAYSRSRFCRALLAEEALTVADSTVSLTSRPDLTIEILIEAASMSVANSAMTYNGDPAFTVSGISPSFGVAQGGMDVTVAGAGLADVQLLIDDEDVAIVSKTDSQIVFTMPPLNPGSEPADILLRTDRGAVLLTDAFYPLPYSAVSTGENEANFTLDGLDSDEIGYYCYMVDDFSPDNPPTETYIYENGSKTALTDGKINIALNNLAARPQVLYIVFANTSNQLEPGIMLVYIPVHEGGGAATVPAAPTAVTAEAGDGQATISFSDPVSDGGSAIIDYTVTSDPGGITGTGNSSPITVTGLSNGITYTFTVTARNSVGTSAPSMVSNSVNLAVVSVTGVIVSPPAVDMQKGGAAQLFAATVSGANSPAQTVTWSVSGGTSASTVITSGGSLTVGADETAATLAVTATSTVDTGKSGVATVTVTSAPPTPIYSVLLDADDHAFMAATEGYGSQTPLPATISNTGNQATGALTVALSGANASDFTVSATTVNSIAVGGVDTFTVVPNTGLTAGTYSATITVSGANGITANFNVRFTVNAAPATLYTITFNSNGGAVAPTSAQTGADGKLASLPAPSRSGSYSFGGWWTAARGGTQITTSTVFNANTTIYARWTYTGGDDSSSDVGATTPSTDKTTEVGGNKVATPAGKDPVKNADGSTTLPGGGTVETGNGVAIKAPDGTTIDNDGIVTIPSGKTADVTLPGGITATISGGSTIGSDGQVTTGGSSTVKSPGGATVTLPGGSAIGPAFGGTITVGSGGGTVRYSGGVSVSLAAGEVIKIDDLDVPLGAAQADAVFNNPFADVKESDWFYGDVAWAYTNNLMKGTSAAEFSPNAPMTHGMLVTVLFGLEEPAKGSSVASIADTSLDKFYSDAVAWVVGSGIVNGYDETDFDPDDAITREQMAAMLYNYTSYLGLTPEGGATKLNFTDTDKVSEWARTAAAWCVENGIINGKPDNIFDPQANVTRAEVAAMFHRFAEKALRQSGIDNASYISGQDRVLTAVEVSKKGWEKADSVIVAPGTDQNLIDALAAAPLAGQENAPTLLSLNGGLSAGTLAEIQRLGTQKAYVIGFGAQTAAEQLKAAIPGIEVEVLQGADRMDTVAKINAKITNPQGVFLVGENALADAVSAGSYAAANGWLIQITDVDKNYDAGYWLEANPNTANVSAANKIIVGGSGVVSDTADFTRVSGSDRYATNMALREALPYGKEAVYFANGATLVDALTGAGLAAKTGSAIVLTPQNDPIKAQFGNRINIKTRYYGLGGKQF